MISGSEIRLCPATVLQFPTLAWNEVLKVTHHRSAPWGWSSGCWCRSGWGMHRLQRPKPIARLDVVAGLVKIALAMLADHVSGGSVTGFGQAAPSTFPRTVSSSVGVGSRGLRRPHRRPRPGRFGIP